MGVPFLSSRGNFTCKQTWETCFHHDPGQTRKTPALPSIPVADGLRFWLIFPSKFSLPDSSFTSTEKGEYNADSRHLVLEHLNLWKRCWECSNYNSRRRTWFSIQKGEIWGLPKWCPTVPTVNPYFTRGLGLGAPWCRNPCMMQWSW